MTPDVIAIVSTATATAPLLGNPFDLQDTRAYAVWREAKLARYPRHVAELIVNVQDPRALDETERDALTQVCERANLAIYHTSQSVDKYSVRRLGAQLGLRRLDSNLCADHDSVSSIRVRGHGIHAGYIPYTARALNWHTDGYYNPADQRIRAFVMHCVHDAAEGGANELLDPEMAYLLMRDESPDYVAALSHPQAMTIPANTDNGNTRRDVQTGPVFSIDPELGTLYMRYTARTRSIVWRDDVTTHRALSWLAELLASDGPYKFTHRLRPGQGIVCNNVLHNRSLFTDAPGRGRLLFRARYYDRIRGNDTRNI